MFRDLVVLLSYVTTMVVSACVVFLMVWGGYWPMALLVIGVLGIVAFEPDWVGSLANWGNDTAWGRAFDKLTWVVWVAIITAGLASVVFDILYS
jgi:hypothetical protein